jgi:hypothetical protein
MYAVFCKYLPYSHIKIPRDDSHGHLRHSIRCNTTVKYVLYLKYAYTIIIWSVSGGAFDQNGPKITQNVFSFFSSIPFVTISLEINYLFNRKRKFLIILGALSELNSRDKNIIYSQAHHSQPNMGHKTNLIVFWLLMVQGSKKQYMKHFCAKKMGMGSAVCVGGWICAVSLPN